MNKVFVRTCQICQEVIFVTSGYVVVFAPARQQKRPDYICQTCWLDMLAAALPYYTSRRRELG